jgi:anaerobic selenocysteine-containing dehydrogenase
VAGARTVISLDRFLTASSRQADVVLPVAGIAETEGTTTNFEGRVTTLHQKVTPPGTARTDWMIAAELAARLGSDLGASSAEDLWAELVANSEVHAGLDASVLADPANADGVLLPLDPAAFPTPEPTHVPPKGAYELRLVVNRTLYDAGTDLSHCESSAGLAPRGVVRLSPADASPVGITTGSRVVLSSPHGSLSLDAVVDAAVPKGSAALRHNLVGADAGQLIDAGDVVCDVRVEATS